MADGVTDAIKADENAPTDVTVGAMVNNVYNRAYGKCLITMVQDYPQMVLVART